MHPVSIRSGSPSHARPDSQFAVREVSRGPGCGPDRREPSAKRARVGNQLPHLAHLEEIPGRRSQPGRGRLRRADTLEAGTGSVGLAHARDSPPRSRHLGPAAPRSIVALGAPFAGGWSLGRDRRNTPARRDPRPGGPGPVLVKSRQCHADGPSAVAGCTSLGTPDDPGNGAQCERHANARIGCLSRRSALRRARAHCHLACADCSRQRLLDRSRLPVASRTGRGHVKRQRRRQLVMEGG